MKKTKVIDPSPIKQIMVLLAEDHTNFRKSLKLLLESEADIEVVGEAINGHEALYLTKSLHPEVVVMDIAMPLLNGLEATREIKKACPATKVLILSAHPEPEYIEQAMCLSSPAFLMSNRIDGAFTTVHLINFERDATLRDCLGILRLLACHCINLCAKVCASKTKLYLA